MKASALVVLPESMWPALFDWQRTLAQARRSSLFLPTTVHAISRSYSIRNSFDRRNYPCRNGSSAGRTLNHRSKRVDMPTECLFREDSYLKNCEARVVALTEQGGIVLDRTVFYATSGGQPGDAGELATENGSRISIEIANYTDAEKSEITHVPPADAPTLKIGDRVTAVIDWDKRYARMRMHTALHLLSAVLPYAVTGGSVGDSESRLDFDIPEAGLDKDAITAKIAEMISSNASVSSRWITDAELEATGPRQNHVGETTNGNRPRAADRNCRSRSATLRGHTCARDRGNRRCPCHADRKEGQAKPPRSFSSNLARITVLAQFVVT